MGVIEYHCVTWCSARPDKVQTKPRQSPDRAHTKAVQMPDKDHTNSRQNQTKFRQSSGKVQTTVRQIPMNGCKGLIKRNEIR